MSAHRKKSSPSEEEAARAAAAAAAATTEDAAATPVPEETVEYGRDHCMRAMAEVQNLKRRAAQEIEERTLLRLESLLSELLRVDDYFSAALASIPPAVQEAEGAPSFLAGIGAIRQALESVLLGHGAVFLAPGADVPFDPAEHEAVEVLEQAGIEAERIELLSRGCRFGRRILRPARVRLLRPVTGA